MKRQDLSESNRQREWTPEMRAKLAASVARRAQEHPDGPETREAKGAASRGKPKSEETKAKMAEARRRFWAEKTPEERSAIVKKGHAAPSHMEHMARMHRARNPRGEAIIAAFLTARGIPFEYQKVYGRYIVDFYLPEQDLIVEIDEDHHREVEVRAREEARTAWFKEQGYRVLHLSDTTVLAGDVTALAAAITG